MEIHVLLQKWTVKTIHLKWIKAELHCSDNEVDNYHDAKRTHSIGWMSVLSFSLSLQSDSAFNVVVYFLPNKERHVIVVTLVKTKVDPSTLKGNSCMSPDKL